MVSLIVRIPIQLMVTISVVLALTTACASAPVVEVHEPSDIVPLG